MPVMDGIEATKQFRVRETQTGAPHLPIVTLAAGAYDEDRQHCLAAGMDDFLSTFSSCIRSWQSGLVLDGARIEPDFPD